jgi:hypothetical protein
MTGNRFVRSPDAGGTEAAPWNGSRSSGTPEAT